MFFTDYSYQDIQLAVNWIDSSEINEAQRIKSVFSQCRQSIKTKLISGSSFIRMPRQLLQLNSLSCLKMRPQ